MAQETTTMHRDPVCGMDVDEKTAAGRSTHAGEQFYFCCGGCKTKFDRNPEQYVSSKPAQSGGGCGCGCAH